MSLEELSPLAERRYLDRLARLSLAERLVSALDVTDTARAFLEGGIRHRHPDATDRDVQACVAALLCGRPVAERLYGPLRYEGP